MKLPRNKYALDQIFKNADVPKSSELQGVYFVDMLTGLPSFSKFSHRKVFYSEDDKSSEISGYNMVFKKKIWGHFFLEKGKCKDFYSLKSVMINYKRRENSFVAKRIRDYIRCVERDSLYLGRFNYIIMGKSYFVGYFSLTKKK